MKNAFAYCRYSSHNQDDGWSIEAQKSAIQKYAKDNHMKVIEWFIDEAKTGRNTNRDGYQRLMTALAQGEIKVLLVHKLDRFHRNAANQLHDLQMLDSLGVRFIATADGTDSSDHSSKLIATIKSALAEEFSENLSKETRKGLREAAKICLHCGGAPPFGFTIDDDKHLAIDEAAAPAVRRIFQMYLADMGYKAILDWLKENGYETQKGNAFSKSSLHSILQNEKYAGIFTYDKTEGKDENGRRNSHKTKQEYIRIPGGCPAIVSEEDFYQVQEKMKHRKDTSSSHSSKHYYPLNGKVWNPDELRYSGNVNHSNGKKYFQYRCAEASGGKSVNADQLNTAVAYAMRTILLADSNHEEILNALNACSKEQTSQNDAVCRELKQKKAALANKKNNLMELLENGKCSDSLLSRLEAIEAEHDQITKQIQQLAKQNHTYTEEDFHKLKEQFVPYLTTQQTLEAKKLLDAVVNKVVIGNDQVEIKFNPGFAVDRDTINYFKGGSHNG